MLTTAQLAKLPPGPPVHEPVEGVGWDINALPNERTDVEGRVLPAPIDDAGNMEDQTSPPLRAYDAPEVVALLAVFVFAAPAVVAEESNPLGKVFELMSA